MAVPLQTSMHGFDATNTCICLSVHAKLCLTCNLQLTSKVNPRANIAGLGLKRIYLVRGGKHRNPAEQKEALGTQLALFESDAAGCLDLVQTLSYSGHFMGCHRRSDVQKPGAGAIGLTKKAKEAAVNNVILTKRCENRTPLLFRS